VIPEEAVGDVTAQEVPERLRGQDNAATVKAMLMRLEKMDRDAGGTKPRYYRTAT